MAAITVSELATELNTDPRTARKFLRSITPAENHPGKGSRWSIEKREVRSLKSKFAAFQKAAADRAEARAQGDEPTDEELAEIEAD